MTEYERRQKELREALSRELQQVGEEGAKVEQQIEDEWYKIHGPRRGLDGGPILQLKEVWAQQREQVFQIIKKYEALGLERKLPKEE